MGVQERGLPVTILPESAPRAVVFPGGGWRKQQPGRRSAAPAGVPGNIWRSISASRAKAVNSTTGASFGYTGSQTGIILFSGATACEWQPKTELPLGKSLFRPQRYLAGRVGLNIQGNHEEEGRCAKNAKPSGGKKTLHFARLKDEEIMYCDQLPGQKLLTSPQGKQYWPVPFCWQAQEVFPVLGQYSVRQKQTRLFASALRTVAAFTPAPHWTLRRRMATNPVPERILSQNEAFEFTMVFVLKMKK